MKCHYRIEYFNELWNDWIYFDNTFYNTEEQAQARVNEYNEHKLGNKLRISQTTILYEKPRRVRAKDMGRKTSVRQERVN